MPSTTRMPAFFFGHGNPMNAIEDNVFSRKWQEVAKILPKPEAILCISAHWETEGSAVTAMEHPKTIHDFYGFPEELYKVRYPAPGNLDLAEMVKDTVSSAKIRMDESWGLDHGTWSVLSRMFPHADIPVVQLSLDRTKPAEYHYQLGKELAPLREKGILIIGSGNIVHNLRLVAFRGADFNDPFALDWAEEADRIIKEKIQENRYDELVRYRELGNSVKLAIPTPEHYLPMLYTLALKQENEKLEYFNDVPVAGSLTMTSFIVSCTKFSGKNLLFLG